MARSMGMRTTPCLPVRPAVGGKRFVFLGMELLYGYRRMIFDTRFGWNLKIARGHRVRLRADCGMPGKVLEGAIHDKTDDNDHDGEPGAGKHNGSNAGISRLMTRPGW